MDKSSETNKTHNNNEEIISKINELIGSYNNKDNFDKITKIIELVINNLDIPTQNNDSNQATSPNISQQLTDADSLLKTNQQNINANQSTININNTNQPTININQPNIANDAETTGTSKQDSGETSDEPSTGTDPPPAGTDTTPSEALQGIIDRITQINTLKLQLCQLPLNPCEREYVANSITPLLQILDVLARTTSSLATSVNILTTSPIVPRKKTKLKNSIRLMYDLNEESECVYKILKKRINTLLCD